EQTVKHFAIAQWADFVRGLQMPERETMRQHLSSCEKCAHVAGLFGRLNTVASRPEVPEVPDYLVRSAHALFALNKPEKVTVSKVIAKLMYDSFREPLPSGVRAQQSLTRQALYEAGDFCIDLRLDYKKGDQQVGMIGQVVNKKNPDLPSAGLPVVLKSGANWVAETSTNDHGEFQLDYQPGVRLLLHIPMDEQYIELPLNDVAKNIRRKN
ncbi:MAG TPA: hypothetical protein VFP40_20100, partial [Terriglobales bacterium]|nr:hypothetical protein [Terriglobales bacterium]